MSERWQQVKQLLGQALQLQGEEREAFLAKACEAEHSLRRELESLLLAHANAEGFMESPAVEELLASTAASTLPASVGQRMGNYKLLKEIGRGGMGIVYLATRADDLFKKRVAVKLLKRGMDSESILARFRRERQILAALEHPNIARLLDAGTAETGLPYFVMEYVEGKPLLAYCCALQLPTKARLELFLAVCRAVAYAHRNSVVHRDLKPSNILVSSDGYVKLLDFGIAKLLNPELLGQTFDGTATGQRAMTPEYASPEQIRGEAITTACDVYAMGVLLYTLLTGCSPYRLKKRSAEELAQAICNQEPDKPSVALSSNETIVGTENTLSESERPTPARKRREDLREVRRCLSGDLDAIVLKCLRKEPQNRYQSAESLAQDIEQFLAGRPVTARRGTFTYYAGKFLKRHKGVAMMTAFALATSAMALLVGTKLSSQEGKASSKQALASAQTPKSTRSLIVAAGRELSEMFYQGKTAEIWSRMTANMQEELKSEEGIAAIRQQIDQQFGTETKILDEQVVSSPPYRTYLRTVSFSKVPNPLIVQWAFDESAKVAGLFFKPVAEPTNTGATTVLDQGRELTTLFYKGEVGPIWSRMTSEMRHLFETEQNFVAFRQKVDEQFGTETKVIDEKTTRSVPYQVYLRTASFSRFAKPVAVQWTLDGDGKIAAFFVKAAE